MSHCMSTTAFNNGRLRQQHQRGAHTLGLADVRQKQMRSSNNHHHQRRLRTQSRASFGFEDTNKDVSSTLSSSSHLMLRKTDSVVEKMLTNWLALSMYDYFHGNAGQALYMMFEAIKCQLERGPIDSVSGDAYYSLNEHKLLRGPHIQFEVVNLYIIVDTEILSGPTASGGNGNSLLLGSSALPPLSYNGQSIYEQTDGLMTASNRNSRSNYATSATTNTITLALRVLDCDTISQVKAKILNALYRNSPYSSRLSVDDVTLSLRQQQQPNQPLQQQHLQLQQQQPQLNNHQHYVMVSLFDEDFSSVSAFNGMKRINTLRHYGINDQAIMTLNRCHRQPTSGRTVCQSTTRTTLTDMLDEHYNNPYSEIQYGPIGRQSSLGGHSNSNNIGHQHQQRVATASAVECRPSWHLIRSADAQNAVHSSSDGHSNGSSPSSHSPSMMLLGNENLLTSQSHQQNQQHLKQQQQQQYYQPSSSSTSSTGNVMDTNSTSANSNSIMNVNNLLMKSRAEQPIYCQIGSTSARSQHGGAGGSNYYCQIGATNPLQTNNSGNSNNFNLLDYQHQRSASGMIEQGELSQAYLTRMLTSKGTIQGYIDDFFKTILSARPSLSGQLDDEANQFTKSVLCADSSTTLRRGVAPNGACPPAVKWLFDILDEAAMENGITDQSVIHAWKSNAFLLRFWANFIKNPNYILDVEKSNTLDASLSVVAQTLMDSCLVNEQKLNKNSTSNKLLFAREVPKYKNLVKRFYQDISSMKPVSDQEMVKQMSLLSMSNTGKFDTNLALKELCVYAVNYGVEIMEALNNDFTCQQLNLSQQLEQCFRSFAIFEAYR